MSVRYILIERLISEEDMARTERLNRRLRIGTVVVVLMAVLAALGLAYTAVLP